MCSPSVLPCVRRSARDLRLPAPALAASLLLSIGTLFWSGWSSVDPADLAATESATNPGADAEILLSEHEISQTSSETRSNDHIRAKVYTRKGVEDKAKFTLEFPDNCRIRTPDARVVKPDGTSVELKKSDIFETVVAKVGGEKVKQVAFAFPDLAPGDIVEYRWTTYLNGDNLGQWAYSQGLIPVREYRFSVGSMINAGTVAWLNTPNATQRASLQSIEVTARNLPAFEEEEYMPPDREFRGWIFLTRNFPPYTPKDTWEIISSYWADEFEAASRPGGTFKAKAAEIAAGATTADEKLHTLYDFCQREITNYSWVKTPEIQEAREKSRKEPLQTPKRVLDRRAGWQPEIDLLFATLARGAGFKVRQARNTSKADLLNVRTPTGWAFLDRSCVAVEVDGHWRHFTPGAYFIPYGMQAWTDEGVTMLRCDEKLLFDNSAVSSPSTPPTRRKGRFTLDAEGTLTGEAEESYTGHRAIATKASWWADSDEDVNKDLREAIAKRLPNAEVTDIEWTNLRSRELPLVVKYRVHVPGYAVQAGKRLAFAPSFFEAGAPVIFAAAERKFPIMFPYARGEQDDVEIVLPEGYALDQPSAPAAVGVVGEAFSSTYKIQYSGKTRALGYRRDFALGANGVFAFRKEAYPVLKGLFEQLHASDTHSIMLKPKATPAAAASAAAAAPEAGPTPPPAPQQ